MMEIEIKAALRGVDRDGLLARIAKLGFTEDYACRESDTYYNGCGRDFRKTDEALRLRKHTQDGSTRTCVTYKGAKQDSRSQTRSELETQVADAAIMRAILERLGFRPVLDVRKNRRGFRGSGACAGVNLCLDEVDGLGPYLELETVAPDETGAQKKESILDGLLSLLDALQVPRENLGRKSYLELLMARDTSEKSSHGV